ncbi:hypothetical protein AM493_18770 [Flavobacterium akiainvivens]|uniref:DUF4168 domain-containing protein n=1 Tax=Flavobacterium akiainvivens TaxID=1202724 RepID=A0A0M8MBS8_9FLAO|nr:hypothetical protein [Flavobacterium akiainvivens]KOS07873.1 hypothetical protein AM493_18770 [Flavobacterium akiainvivens]SFQ27909.1 hypothetical protein SAMN05444144_102336 [Flavobacterium akiainvivens]
MKKIIALFIVMLGVSFTASAQKTAKPAVAAKPAAVADSKESKIQQAAVNDTKILNETVGGLTTAQMRDFKSLFEQKHRSLSDALTDERKSSIWQAIDAKIKATLTPEQLEKLNSKPEVLKKITH